MISIKDTQKKTVDKDLSFFHELYHLATTLNFFQKTIKNIQKVKDKRIIRF